MEMLMEVLVGIFGFVLTILGTIIIMNFKKLTVSTEKISDNMVKMNIRLERAITDQSWHKEEMSEVKVRLGSLERMNKGVE